MSNTLLWRPFADEYIRDPYEMYRVLRTQDPVHVAQTKEIIITGYDDVRDILKSSSFQTGNRLEWLKRGIHYLQKKDEDFNAIYTAINSFVLMLNPPQHTRIRTFVAKAWDNRDADTIINTNIKKILNGLKGQDSFDAVADYSQPLSVHTICNILGIEANDHRYLKNLGLTMSKAVDLYPSLKDMVNVNEAARAFVEFFREHIRTKNEKQDDGLLSKLIQRNRIDNTGLQDDELISLAIFLFIAGQETSSALISNGIYTLLRHPEELQKMKQDPTLTDSAVEEVLRFDSTVQLLGRIAKEDYPIKNKTITAGSAVTLVIGSANRDEKIFDSPDTFRIERKPNRHLSFGSGIHFCLGDWLGRRMGQLAIGDFFSNYPHISLPDQQIQWNKNLAIRSLTGLRIQAKA
jgi:cytochrome P450